MPARKLVSTELASLFGILAHSQRIRIVEELGQGEKDVHHLETLLGISQSGVSQHLALLRGKKIVKARREGRHLYYSLTQPWLASWILQGLRFLETESYDSNKFRNAVKRIKDLWPMS